MTERLVEAFGVHPFDLYATTEGLWGVECERHEGIHLFEDVALFENVDEEGRPVPAGEPGARLLVTSLHNLVQPIIRLEVTDVFTIDGAVPMRPDARAGAGDRGPQRRRADSRRGTAAGSGCTPSSSGS